MAEAYYDRLSFQDSSFLAIESPSSHMHVSGIATFETGGLRSASGGVDVERIRDYVASRLHLIPRYRQVIRHVPVENHPVWVDDAHFNIHYHVRHTCLPQPGDPKQLKLMAGRIMAQKLDRAKPLWEMWIVEGLDGGEKLAMINKVHHCMVDGMSGVELMSVLLSSEPADTVEPPEPWEPRPAPSDAELAAAEAMRWIRGPLDLLRAAPDILEDLLDPTSEVREKLAALGDTLTSVQSVSDTPFNRPIGPHRRFDWLNMPLEDIKRVKRLLGGTLNDVVLATVTGAVDRFLSRRGLDPRALNFRVAAPVSMRSSSEKGTMGNRVSAWIIPLPLAEKDPRLRIRRVSEVTSVLKESKQALGAETIMRVGEWTPSTLLTLGARMAQRALPINMVVTNVPGPQLPLYLLDSRLLEHYGQVPLMDYLGIGIALFSYDGQLCWGFNADWDAVPDVADFAGDVRDAFEEMREMADTVEGRQEAGTA